MGSTQSKRSTPVKEITQIAESERKGFVIDRIAKLRNRGGKMARRLNSLSGSMMTDGQEDTIMANNETAGESSQKGTISSSRRRTRSMGISELDEDEIEENEENVVLRRIRRKIKGKSKEVSDDNEDLERVQETEMQATGSGESAALLPSHSSTIPSEKKDSRRKPPISQSTSSSWHESDLSMTPRDIDQAPATVPSPILAHQPNVTTNSTSSFPLNPFEFSGEERSSARARLAQALGQNTFESSTTEQISTANDQFRPSMLSALLNDILGLRTSQMTAASANHVQAAASAEARQRTGGTSVIVQGALISRTLSSRSSTGTQDRIEAPSTRDGESIYTSMHPSQASSLAPAPALQDFDESVGHGRDEPQVATIEEQAAMLIRLLSIATAATAASITSRPIGPQQVNLDIQQGSVPTNAPQDQEQSSQAIIDVEHSAVADTSSFELPVNDSGTSSIPASQSLSSSLPWRQASQPFQILRARFSALRSRIRNRNAPRQAERRLQESLPRHQVNLTSVAQDLNATPVATREAIDTSSAALPRQTRQDLSTGSLESLSSMLQEAIRRGVNRANGNSEGQGNNTENFDNESNGSNRSDNVQATLNAVREGNLARGEEGTFDRFLYELMMDLDAAVRQLPRRENTEEVNQDFSDESMTSRRRGDMREGQLTFFRSFTFPTIPTIPTISTSSSGNLEQQSHDAAPGLVPCIIVGVRSLRDGQTLTSRVATREAQNETINSTTQTLNTAAEVRNTTSAFDPLSSMDGQVIEASTNSTATLSRFLLFVSGGHYPPQHPLFLSSSEEAARDLMVLIEFLGAITSFQTKSSTVTKEEIEKSTLRVLTGGLKEISTLVKMNKIMENTCERCLICLEDWKNDDEKKRLLECSHLFHAHCIDQWLTASNNSCPLCRRQAISKKAANPIERP